MKKKIAAIALVVCIVAIAVIGATMAYFTDTESKTNTFTFGKVDITLTEESKESTGVEKGTPKEDGTGFTYTNILPNLVYSKEPTVTVTNESTAAWVVVKVTVPALYDWDGLFNKTANTTDFFTADRTTAGEYVVYTFYSRNTVAPGAGVTPFTQIRVKPSLTQTDLVNAPEFNVTVSAYAIQSEGFTGAKGAYDAAFATPPTP